jgi:hypothetical protein
VRGGYERSYAEFLTAEHEALARGDSPFAIRSVIESWEAAVGAGAVTVLWMEELVADPVASWTRLAAEIGVPAFAAVGRVPMEHRNPTVLGPLSWELRLNRILRSRSDRRRADLTHRIRRFHSRHLGPQLHRFARDELVGGEQERSLLAAMDADIAWVRARFPTGSQDVSHPDEA